MSLPSGMLLPPGTYLINNGPKAKGRNGKFSNANTHQDVMKLFESNPNIKFTDVPQKADYVLLPEGVREVGDKAKKLNPLLANPENVFSMDKIMMSKAYSVKSSKSRRKRGLMYTTKDSSGNTVQIEIPANLEPSDQKYTQLISKVTDAKTVQLDLPYPVIRRATRGVQEPIIVPGPAPSLKQESAPSPQPQLADQLMQPTIVPVSPVQPVEPVQVSPVQQTLPMPPLEEVPQISAKLDEIDGLLSRLSQTTQKAPVVSKPPDQLRPLVDKLRNIYDTYYVGSNTKYANSVTMQESIANLLNSVVYVVVNKNQLDKASISTFREEAVKKAKAVEEYGTLFISNLIQQVLTQLDLLLDNEAEFLYYWQKSQIIFDAIEYLKEDNRRQIANSVGQRSEVFKSYRDSTYGLKCKSSDDMMCNGKDDPLHIAHQISQLFDLSCKLVQQPSSEFSPELSFQQQCKTESIHASLCDVYNCLYVEVLGKIGEQKIMPMQSMLCQHLYEAMNRAMDLIGNTKMTLLSTIQKLQSFHTIVNDIFVDSQQGTPVPSVYANFFTFLTRRYPNSGESVSDRYAIFQTLKKQCVGRDDLFVDMFAMSLVFLMLNFCEGSSGGWFSSSTGTGSLENIIKTLKTDYRPTTEKEEEEPIDQPWES